MQIIIVSLCYWERSKRKDKLDDAVKQEETQDPSSLLGMRGWDYGMNEGSDFANGTDHSLSKQDSRHVEGEGSQWLEKYNMVSSQ